MAEMTGSALYLAFKGTAIQADFREFTASTEMGTVDASAGSDTGRSYLTTLEDGTASAMLLLQTGGTASTDPRQLCAVGAEGTLEWGPEGTAAGKPRRYVNAIVTSLEESIPYEDVVELSIEWQFSANASVTNTVYS